MLQPITIEHAVRPKSRSLASGQVYDLFGLDAAEPPHVVARGLALDITPRDVVLFTGPSGSGKSSLLRAAGAQLDALDAMALVLPDLPLIDALPGPVAERLATLAACGLAEARLTLRTPDELSDGQRYRFRIAFALREAARLKTTCIMLDEFTAMLDRTLAKVVAFNLRKAATRTGLGILAATTHEDIVDDLQADVHVRCAGDGDVSVTRGAVKKKPSASPRTSGSATAPSPTGRISLGGITAAIMSPSPAA
jgi:hypothetical protein